MMKFSAKAFFNDGTDRNIRLVIGNAEMIPSQFVALYKINVRDLTPIKSGALRRSLVTQVLGNQAKIGWRVSYAAAQNVGHFKARRTYVVNTHYLKPKGGRSKSSNYITIKRGQTYNFNVHPRGGQSQFATLAFRATKAQLEARLGKGMLVPKPYMFGNIPISKE